MMRKSSGKCVLAVIMAAALCMSACGGAGQATTAGTADESTASGFGSGLTADTSGVGNGGMDAVGAARVENGGADAVGAENGEANPAEAGNVGANAASAENGQADAASAVNSGTAEAVTASNTDNSANDTASEIIYSKVTAEMVNFKSSDKYEKWAPSAAMRVTANGDSVTIKGNGVGISADGADVSVTAGGIYVFEGSLNGKITVNAGEKEKVRLILNGISITSPDGPAIQIIESDKVTVSLEGGTENVVTDSETYSDTDLSAAIYSRADLVFNGSGTLRVNAKHNNGIQSKDDLRILGGTYVVDAVDDGISGKDRLEIRDGTFEITSGGDALKTTNVEVSDRGFAYIEGGEFVLTSGDEAIDAAGSILISGGEFAIKTGGGSANAVRESSEWGFGGQGFPGGREFGRGFGKRDSAGEAGLSGESASEKESGGTQGGSEADRSVTESGSKEGKPGETQKTAATAETAHIGLEILAAGEGRRTLKNGAYVKSMGFQMLASTDESSASAEALQAAEIADEYDDTDSGSGTAFGKGIKCGGVLEISGGAFEMDTYDDALHSDDQVLISGGKLTANAGDDGIHADDTLEISGGTIVIEDCYEGLEAVNINISGGDTSVTASDDGVNAAGGEITSDAGFSAGPMGGGMNGSGTVGSDSRPENVSGIAGSGTGAGGFGGPGGFSDESGFGGSGGFPDESGFGGPGVFSDESGFDGPSGFSNNGMGGMPGGGMMFGESAGYLTITGGRLYVNSGGDGLDANTDITQTGGTVIVEGPTDSGNGSFDYGNSYMMSGGTMTAIGSQGMLQTISEDSSCCALTVLFSDNVAAGTKISLKNSSKKEIATITTTKVAGMFQFAGSGLSEGGTYALYLDGEKTCEITLTGTVTTVDDSGEAATVYGFGMGGGHMRA
ncbi:MAG: carbohydrate-binding domain-containing protein [Lachnospiraceae bacterium]|nr:carbohydrate-binding domain-containing protein [Lachnospiraceae bacterium]